MTYVQISEVGIQGPPGVDGADRPLPKTAAFKTGSRLGPMTLYKQPASSLSIHDNDISDDGMQIVYVTASSTIIYSLDGGITWATKVAVSGATYTNVAYGNGYWVIQGLNATNTYMAYTTDPSGTWTAFNPHGTNLYPGFAELEYGDGWWLSIGGNDKVAYINGNPDMGTWVATTGTVLMGSSIAGGVMQVVHANGQWVVATIGGGNWYNNGNPSSGWAKTDNSLNHYWADVEYGDGYWVAWDGSLNALVYTDTVDGSAWSPCTVNGLGAYAFPGSIAYDWRGKRWYAYRQLGFGTPDPTEWMYVDGPPSNTWTAVLDMFALENNNRRCRSNPAHTVHGGEGGFVVHNLDTSPALDTDLFPRVIKPTAATNSWYAADTDGAGTYVVVGTGGGVLYTKDNGLTWTSTTKGSNTFLDVAYGNGYWVAVGYANTNYYFTDPAGTWTSFNPFGNSVNSYSVAYGNGYWAICQIFGGLFGSINGNPTGTWVTSNTYFDGAHALQYRMKYNAEDDIWYSGGYYRDSNPQGNWTASTNGNTAGMITKKINGYYTLGGFSGSVLYSTDAKTWSTVTLPAGWGTQHNSAVPVWDGTKWIVHSSTLGYRRQFMSAPDPTGEWNYDGVDTHPINWATSSLSAAQNGDVFVQPNRSGYLFTNLNTDASPAKGGFAKFRNHDALPPGFSEYGYDDAELTGTDIRVLVDGTYHATWHYRVAPATGTTIVAGGGTLRAYLTVNGNVYGPASNIVPVTQIPAGAAVTLADYPVTGSADLVLRAGDIVKVRYKWTGTSDKDLLESRDAVVTLRRYA